MDYDNNDGFLTKETKAFYLKAGLIILLFIIMVIIASFMVEASADLNYISPEAPTDIVIFKARCCLWGTVCWEEKQHWHETIFYEGLLYPKSPDEHILKRKEDNQGCFIESL